jgi:long-chain acyl-CoA synthetase
LLDPLITESGLGYYLNDTKSACLITRSKKEQLARYADSRISIVSDVEILPLTESDAGPGYERQAYSFKEDQLAAVFYTSGTTSHPKGVMLSPANFESHYRIFTRCCYQYKQSDVLLCFVPFSHGYGSKSIFIPCLKAGAAMVILRSFHPVRVAELIEAYNITHLFGVPSHFQQLLRKDELINSMRKLKAAFSAAALLKLETARKWKEKTGFCLDEGYGLIETCTGVAFRMGKIPDRLGHIGSYPADLIDVEIMDDNHKILSKGERGEIVVKGASVMKGYLNKPEESARVLYDGWFRTGDMGFKTEQNALVMTGRIKDVINVAGIKVAPFEIEAALNEHPKVSESAVIGVEDDMYGEVVKAFVKPVNDTRPQERELKLFLQKLLINFQVPKEIVVIDDFPRNNMGKIDKKALALL